MSEQEQFLMIGSEGTLEPVLRLEKNGDIFLKGRLLVNDLEIVDGFREFFKCCGIKVDISIQEELTSLRQKVERYENLCKVILAWWGEHKYDVDSVPNGEYTEEYNRFDTEPDFVTLALREEGKEETK